MGNESDSADVPWRSDRELDAGIVRAVLGEQFPVLDVVDIAYLHAGWDSEAYDVTTRDGRRWVFRFPKRAEVEPWLATERRLLPELRPTLPLPIPQFAYHGRPSARFPFHFVGYLKIDGSRGDLVGVPPAALPRIAAQLGPFLSALHAFPVARARDLGLPVDPPNHFEKRRREIESLWPRLRDRLPDAVRARCESFVRATDLPALRDADLRLTHADLQGDHVVLDPATAAVRGVIDWGDVRLSDPSIDLAGLWVWLGDVFLDHLLRHYAHPLDDSAMARIRFQGRCAALVGLAYADDEDFPVAQREVEAVFSADP